jgi:hypothetical protein
MSKRFPPNLAEHQYDIQYFVEYPDGAIYPVYSSGHKLGKELAILAENWLDRLMRKVRKLWKMIS